MGTPRYINPVLAGTNQTDIDLVKLVYSGLVRITPGREAVPDLASSWQLENQNKTYVFTLRQGVTWHDGAPFTADDVVYTFNVFQNNDYNGVLKANFAGVTVEKVDDFTVKFTLPAPSSFFLYDLAVGIIPEHIFREVPVRDFTNFYKPSTIIGTGAFAYDNGVSNQSITLKRYKRYYAAMPHLEKVIFYFYDNEKTLASAFRNRTVTAAGLQDISTIEGAATGNQKFVYNLPQYRAVFFNQLGANAALKDRTVRQALAHSVDKDQLINEIENGNATRVDSPILAGFWGHKADLPKYDFDINRAIQALAGAGWKDIDGDGWLEKDNARLSFKLATRKDPKLHAIAEKLVENWKKIGAEVIVEEYDTASLIKDVIRPRNYDALLFGQDLGGNSDPYVYWHSSEITDPGLALAVEADKDIDSSLEQARTAATVSQAIPAYLRFQDAFVQIVPAILLYTPHYTYIVDSKLKGVTDQINLSSLADRFATIDQWYILTKKVKGQ